MNEWMNVLYRLRELGQSTFSFFASFYYLLIITNSHTSERGHFLLLMSSLTVKWILFYTLYWLGRVQHWYCAVFRPSETRMNETKMQNIRKRSSRPGTWVQYGSLRIKLYRQSISGSQNLHFRTCHQLPACSDAVGFKASSYKAKFYLIQENQLFYNLLFTDSAPKPKCFRRMTWSNFLTWLLWE